MYTASHKHESTSSLKSIRLDSNNEAMVVDLVVSGKNSFM